MSRAQASYPWPASMPAPSREEIESLVEGLIEYLNLTDGDADLEDGSDAELTASEWPGKGAHRFNVGEAA